MAKLFLTSQMNKSYPLLPTDLSYSKTVSIQNARLQPRNSSAENSMSVFTYLILSLLDSCGDKYALLLILEVFEKQQRNNGK